MSRWDHGGPLSMDEVASPRMNQPPSILRAHSSVHNHLLTCAGDDPTLIGVGLTFPKSAQFKDSFHQRSDYSLLRGQGPNGPLESNEALLAGQRDHRSGRPTGVRVRGEGGLDTDRGGGDVQEATADLGPGANPNPALVSQQPFQLPAKSLLRLRVASKVVEYYDRTDRALSASNVMWPRLANFKVEWDTLVDRKKKNDELTLPTTSRSLPIGATVSSF